MQALFDVVLPVFLVVGAGYALAWRGIITEDMVDTLMRFAQGVAIPCLVFMALTRLDLARVFDPRLLVSFYSGALAGFVAGLLGARYLFGRGWEDSIAVGFICLYSNALLLGVPITERAYGAEALGGNYAIIALHTPFCYIIGITAMEGVLARGSGLARTLARVVGGIVRNPLVLGIALGAAVNLAGVTVPSAPAQALDLIARAGLPMALVGLGGVLFRYRPEGDLRIALWAVGVSLILHPVLTWSLGRGLDMGVDQMRSGVVTAAMAPGVNAYLFAHMYGRAKRVAATTVLIGTSLCVVTTWLWMMVLP